jgi:hypothetical protein
MAANPGSLFATVRSFPLRGNVCPGGEQDGEFSELSLELASAFAAGDGLSLCQGLRGGGKA